MLKGITQNVTDALVRNLVFPVWLLKDHPAYPAYIREFEKTQFCSRAQLEELQVRRLRALLTHAYAACPLYRERMDKAGLTPERIRSTADIAALPVLTKRDLQEHGEEVCAGGYNERDRVRNQTGGSTGSPLQFWVDRDRLDSRFASTVRHNRWAGMRPGDWCAEIWGNRLDQLLTNTLWSKFTNALLYRIVELNTSSARSEDWQAFVARLRRYRPRFLVTYANSAAMFARWVREHGVEDVHFDSVITTAEVLASEDRTLIEETFGATVFNRYGCREVSVIASECEHHSGLHVNAEALLVEIVPDPLYPAPAGKVVITDLLNYSMPLIRYEIGDVSAWAEDQECACGRKLPLLGEIQGRTTDFIFLKDGRSVSGPALTLVVSDMKEVRQVQFVQDRLEHVTLRVVPGKAYDSNTEAELRRRLGLYLQGAAEMTIASVDTIASEASGKYRFVVSKLADRVQAKGAC